MENYLSQNPLQVGGTINGIGVYGNPGNSWDILFSGVLSKAIGLLTIVAGVYFIFLLISGGIAWMSSGGDKAKLANARSTMFSGAIGLTIVVAALFIAQIFGGIIDLPNILNPAAILRSLAP
ncbi:MAG: hypothetical protein UT39_C0009G0019 [Candidatus Woesebacteria bacterium GW2011_GWA1_39_21]|uniref:Uncharacterized protein n=1 Tax=Candidatus Woesebacteria bacterium GW2011_GWA1_39_21 TaxID=1618550 RepID=A0A0G0N4Z2_9BACT|nr:MAG: hypothetical protein UT39_C0009G0019 [Candidatus Woesebacteria bacterium GW2011_GWA1_39_21]